MRTMLTVVLAASLWAGVGADPVHPMVDFSLLGQPGDVLKNTETTDKVQIRAYSLIEGEWKAKGKLKVINEGVRDVGVGICSPKDLENDCAGGEIDELGMREMIRIRKPKNQRLTAVWISSLDGPLDNARIGASDRPEPENIFWHTEVFYNQVMFFPRIPTARVPIYLDGRCTAFLWVQAASGQPGTSNFLVWGVDVQENDW